jgi:hypothetical protein
MKTIHASSNLIASSIGTTIANALRDSNIHGDYRIIQCGAGLVLLPETDRSKEATEGEVIKALGFRNKADKMSTENKGERNTFSLSREGEFCTMVSLTPAQVRFLRWCQSEDLFWDEVDFTALGGEVINI